MRKKIIVLGGSSGIGKATAERFAKEGCRYLLQHSPKKLRELRGSSPVLMPLTSQAPCSQLMAG